MATTNGGRVIKLLMDTIRKINGSVSPVNSSYTFNTNLSQTVKRGVGFLPNTVNTIEAYVRRGISLPIYHSNSLAHEDTEFIITLHSKDPDSIEYIYGAVHDVEHILFGSESLVFFPEGIVKMSPLKIEYSGLIEKNLYSATIKINLEYALDHSRL